jgi:hypothetical protein
MALSTGWPYISDRRDIDRLAKAVGVAAPATACVM